MIHLHQNSSELAPLGTDYTYEAKLLLMFLVRERRHPPNSLSRQETSSVLS